MLSLISCRSGAFRRREIRSINNEILPQKLDTKELPENKETPESSEKTVPAFLPPLLDLVAMGVRDGVIFI